MRAYYYRNMDPKTCRELRFLDDLLIVTALCPVGAQELAGGHLYWDGPFFISKQGTNYVFVPCHYCQMENYNEEMHCVLVLGGRYYCRYH